LFKTFRAVSGGAFLGTRESTGSPQVKLVKIGFQGQISPCAPQGTYCQSSGDFPWHDWIARVQLNTLDNQSGKSTHSDFTGLTTTLQKGLSYPITLTAGFSWQTFDEYWRVWIDFNHDGVFSTPDEVVQQQILTAPAAGTPLASVSGSINIPSGALTGTTRMRVSMKRGGFPTACEAIAFGEVEDYMVNITQGLTGDDLNNRAANLDFEAVAEAEQVRLLGAYFYPDGVEQVTVEKSVDGKNYQPLFTLPGKVSGIVETLDGEPVNGFNFYRLRLGMPGGGEEFSPVRVVSFSKLEDFTVFPNPTSGEIFFNLMRQAEEDMRVSVYDRQGRLIWTEEISKDAPSPYRLSLKDWGEGLYLLSAERPGFRPVSRRFVIQK
jgi:hypothetical protein